MKKIVLTSLIISLICIAFSGWADPIPSTINYQGYLSESNGNPLSDGDYDITFRIYNVLTGGTALWTETRTGVNAVSLVNGRFNVSLGSIDSFENAGLDFTEQYYLEIQVGSDQPFSPRLAFNSVPYAIRAKNLDGKTAPVGNIVGTTDIQTLTGKTLSDPVIDGGTIDGAAIGSITSNSGNFTTLSATGDLTVNGRILGRETIDGIEKTGDYTMTDTDDIILVNTSAGAVNVTLPSAAGNSGRPYTVKLKTAGHDLTIVPTGAEKINGIASLTLEQEGQSVHLVSDGTGWQAVGEVGNVCIKHDTSDLGTELDNSGSDSVLLNDLIVEGSECIGFDCVDGELFEFDTLILKENNLRIYFRDTSSTSSFPGNDWRITINESTNGGRSYFSIDDVDGGTSGLVVEAGGDVGIGALKAPQGKLDVKMNAVDGTGTISTIGIVGTGTISSSGTSVTGTGTLFTDELAVGSTITAGGETKSVIFIPDNESLLVDSAWSVDLTDVPFTYPGNTIKGSGTSFTTELNVGTTITAAGKTMEITAITSDDELEVDNAGDTPISDETFKFIDTGLLMTGSGKVGIGTTTPDEKFEIEFGSSETDVEIGQGTSDTDVTFITLRSPNGTKFYITVDDSGNLATSTTKP